MVDIQPQGTSWPVKVDKDSAGENSDGAMFSVLAARVR